MRSTQKKGFNFWDFYLLLSHFPTGVNLPHPRDIGKIPYCAPVLAISSFSALNPGANAAT